MYLSNVYPPQISWLEHSRGCRRIMPNTSDRQLLWRFRHALIARDWPLLLQCFGQLNVCDSRPLGRTNDVVNRRSTQSLRGLETRAQSALPVSMHNWTLNKLLRHYVLHAPYALAVAFHLTLRLSLEEHAAECRLLRTRGEESSEALESAWLRAAESVVRDTHITMTVDHSRRFRGFHYLLDAMRLLCTREATAQVATRVYREVMDSKHVQNAYIKLADMPPEFILLMNAYVAFARYLDWRRQWLTNSQEQHDESETLDTTTPRRPVDVESVAASSELNSEASLDTNYNSFIHPIQQAALELPDHYGEHKLFCRLAADIGLLTSKHPSSARRRLKQFLVDYLQRRPDQLEFVGDVADSHLLNISRTQLIEQLPENVRAPSFEHLHAADVMRVRLAEQDLTNNTPLPAGVAVAHAVSLGELLDFDQHKNDPAIWRLFLVALENVNQNDAGIAQLREGWQLRRIWPWQQYHMADVDDAQLLALKTEAFGLWHELSKCDAARMPPPQPVAAKKPKAETSC